MNESIYHGWQYDDFSILIDWKKGVDESFLTDLLSYKEALQSHLSAEEVVIAYDSLLIIYKRRITAYTDKIKEVHRILAEVKIENSPVGKTIEIPVCYGGESGPDLAHMAEQLDKTETEIITLHSKPLYKVQMIGFLPGFPYLSGLDLALSMPRRETPRPRIPAGSVAIGGNQTGIYPIESPGGWHIIGRTYIPLFSTDKSPPCLLQPGDSLKFVPVPIDIYEKKACKYMATKKQKTV